jgi:DNA invertase Pin-like site-specific DNA recombinase
MNMRVAIYARVSTANNGQDPTMQTRELREYCERRGWQLTGEFIDVGISGTKEKRPELDRLMKAAHRREFDVVAVWKFDRFARSVSHLLRALETFQALGIHFVSLSESIDTATPAGRLVFTVLGAVAELERSLIVERVKAGLRNARAKGKRLGRPQAVVDRSRIASLRARGCSWRTIARQVGCFCPDSSQNRFYAGQKPRAGHSGKCLKRCRRGLSSRARQNHQKSPLVFPPVRGVDVKLETDSRFVFLDQCESGPDEIVGRGW